MQDLAPTATTNTPSSGKLSDPTRAALWTVPALMLLAGMAAMGLALSGAPQRDELVEVQAEVHNAGMLTRQRTGTWKTEPVPHGTAIVLVWDAKWPPEFSSSARSLGSSVVVYLMIHDELPADAVERAASQMPGPRRIALYERQVVSMVDALMPAREILSYTDFERAHRARAVRRGWIGLVCLLGAFTVAGLLRRVLPK
jgi:hypothetical protein